MNKLQFLALRGGKLQTNKRIFTRKEECFVNTYIENDLLYKTCTICSKGYDKNDCMTDAHELYVYVFPGRRIYMGLWVDLVF